MKTRKVGKIVSLLVAIVLVATIMIPAASVLADSAAQKYPGANWVEVSSFKELKTVFDNAKTDGTKTYVKLTGNIDMPQGARFVSGGAKGLFLGEVLKMDKIRQVTGLKESSWTIYDVLLSDPLSDEDTINFLNSAGLGPVTKTNPFDELGQGKYAKDAANFYVILTASNLARWEKINNFREKKYTSSNDPESQAKDYPSYLDVNLVVYAGSDIVLDLNGKTIDAGQGDKVYTGTPNYIQSVFIVNGKLTVEDFVGGGKITGGSGYIAAGTYSLSESEFTDGMERHRYLDSDLNYVDKSMNDTDRWSQVGHDLNRLKWKFSFTNKAGGEVTGGKTNERSAYYINQGSVTEIRGGAVYVESTGEFILNNGAITRNCALMGTESSMIKSSVDGTAKGGAVYVEAGGTFNMYGGEIDQNVARAYQKESNPQESHAYGGGVYVEAAADGKVATFNMYGGTISENATYAETYSGGKTKNVVSEGAGIYVGTGSVCNIMGSADAEGPTTSAMLASFPQITNNSCGAITRNGVREGATVTVKGAGIYCDGTLNIKKALVFSNDFSEFSKDLAASDIVPAGNNVTHIMRDEESGLPLYIYDYNRDGSAKTYVTRLDARFTENLELATEQVAHEASGIYGTARGNENNKLTSDGAGVYLGTTARMNVGERTWITDNYDLVTTGHKAFDNTRNYAKHWDKTANGGAGGYVYTGSSSAGISDGFTWSDTSDDVYLPDGVTMYKGDSLFESRIGVNYYDMVDKAGDVSVGATGRASNRVIVKSATDLDYNLWGATTATPLQTDIQFFSLNDNNKNYERDINYNLPPYVADAKESEYYSAGTGTTARPMDLRGSENGGPALPPGCARGTLQEDGGWPSKSLRDSYLVSVVKASDVEGVIDGTDWTYRKEYLSPYVGYIDFSTKYAAGTTWSVEWSVRFQKDKVWPKYNKDTYWMTAADLNPATEAMANKNVVFPQRAYQIDSAISQLSKYEQRAKFMDYKVIYDDNGFGSDAAPVLRFGEGNRQMYVTYNFDEADKTYYGVNVNDQSLNEAINIDNLITSKSVFKTINTAEDGSSFTFYGANRPTGTLMFNKIVPDYKAYKASNVLDDRSTNRKSELASITKTDGKHEDKDLYFKGWSFYTSYGYGPEIVTLNNKDKLQSINVDAAARSGSSLDYRGTFTADLNKIINQNVNAQPCPSMTATWYTKEELAEARKKVSNVKYQIIKSADNKDLLRVVAIAGSDYPDFEAVGFVISTTNATPTIEGGYDYVANSDIYERLGVTKDGTQMCYDVDRLLGGNYYGAATGNHPSIKIDEEFKWEFTEGSMFADNVTIGQTGKPGYKDAGLFYTNILIDDKNRNTVYFVTPYAKLYDGTYYYGESRAVCYADYYVAS